MPAQFLLYGSTGFVGSHITWLARQRNLPFIIAGRDPVKIKAQAEKWNVEYRVFTLDDPVEMDRVLKEVTAVLHCAGPYLFTSKPMVEGCLRTGTHYLDLTGEIPVYTSLYAHDAEARSRGIMILPGVGFDVVPSDCLALHLKNRLPGATHLSLAYQSVGPAGLPPGTANTMVAMIPYGNKIRKDGRIVTPVLRNDERLIDLGEGPVLAVQLPWGDVFMAYFSTGIPNITDYAVMSDSQRKQWMLSQYIKPLFKISAVRNYVRRQLKSGATPEELASTLTHVWGEATDDHGNKAVSRLHGPEAGVIWTSEIALAVVQKVLNGEHRAGFQTPAKMYGADFVLEYEKVNREDLL